MRKKMSSIVESYFAQIKQAQDMVDKLPLDLRELFDSEIRQNLRGTHINDSNTSTSSANTSETRIKFA